MREARRLELQSQGWHCARSVQEATQAGATIAVVATDTRRHAADAEEALRARLHVLLEKPMAPSAHQAKHLPGLAAEHGVGLFIGCPLRFDPGLGIVRQRLGEIGAIHAVQIECRSYLPDWRPNRDYRQAYSALANEGGVLRDLIHEVDYALWLFGMPRQVFGRLSNLGRLGIQSEEIAEGQWITPSGVHMAMGLDYLSRHPRRSLCIYGDQGEMEYDFVNRKLKLHRAGATPEAITFPRAADDIHIQQMREFLHIASSGVPHLIASAEDGMNALAVCDAWHQSAKTQRIEQVVR